MTTVTLETRPAQRAAVVRGTVVDEDIPEFLREAFEEVRDSLARQGVLPAGPPFGRYQQVDAGFDVEAGFPVSGDVLPDGRVGPTHLPGGEIAEAVHVGPYDDVPSAYGAILDWIEQTGREATGAPWELYLDGPDVAEPRTVVCFPCRRAPDR